MCADDIPYEYTKLSDLGNILDLIGYSLYTFCIARETYKRFGNSKIVIYHVINCTLRCTDNFDIFLIRLNNEPAFFSRKKLTHISFI